MADPACHAQGPGRAAQAAQRLRIDAVGCSSIRIYDSLSERAISPAHRLDADELDSQLRPVGTRALRHPRLRPRSLRLTIRQPSGSAHVDAQFRIPACSQQGRLEDYRSLGLPRFRVGHARWQHLGVRPSSLPPRSSRCSRSFLANIGNSLDPQIRRLIWGFVFYHVI